MVEVSFIAATIGGTVTLVIARHVERHFFEGVWIFPGFMTSRSAIALRQIHGMDGTAFVWAGFLIFPAALLRAVFGGASGFMLRRDSTREK